MKKVCEITLHAIGFRATFPPPTRTHIMKTIVTLSNGSKTKTFTVNGRPSDVSDRIVKIKRALKISMTHSTQSA